MTECRNKNQPSFGQDHNIWSITQTDMEMLVLDYHCAWSAKQYLFQWELYLMDRKQSSGIVSVLCLTSEYPAAQRINWSAWRVLLARNLTQKCTLIHMKWTLVCKTIPPQFRSQPFRVENLLKEDVNWQQSCWQSLCPQALLDFSPPNMPLMTFPKHSKKFCCVRTASGFTDIKVTIYFQSLSPCLAISIMTQLWPISPLIRIHLWQAAPWWLSKNSKPSKSLRCAHIPVLRCYLWGKHNLQALYVEDNRNLHNARSSLF